MLALLKMALFCLRSDGCFGSFGRYSWGVHSCTGISAGRVCKSGAMNIHLRLCTAYVEYAYDEGWLSINARSRASGRRSGRGRRELLTHTSLRSPLFVDQHRANTGSNAVARPDSSSSLRWASIANTDPTRVPSKRGMQWVPLVG
jgi:hypothetical protein